MQGGPGSREGPKVIKQLVGIGKLVLSRVNTVSDTLTSLEALTMPAICHINYSHH